MIVWEDVLLLSYTDAVDGKGVVDISVGGGFTFINRFKDSIAVSYTHPGRWFKYHDGCAYGSVNLGSRLLRVCM